MLNADSSPLQALDTNMLMESYDLRGDQIRGSISPELQQINFSEDKELQGESLRKLNRHTTSISMEAWFYSKKGIAYSQDNY